MTTAAASLRALVPPGRIGMTRDLVLHLASRELKSSHRRTALGWSWPLLVQLVQLAALSFVFGRVLPLGIADYPMFVFSGLVFWSWFRGSLAGAATSVTRNVALVLEPRMPRAVLPLVAVAVATFDLLVSLPVLLVLVAVVSGAHLTWVLLPVLMAVQAVLMAGIGFVVSAAHVYLRDVEHLVATALMILFYLTPVFYPLNSVPGDYQWLFDLNPIAGLIDGYRAILLDGVLPELSRVGALILAAVAFLGAGWFVFRRLQPGFVDEL